MAKCERDLWWYRCLHELTVEKILKYSPVKDPSILDAGCGTGGLIQHLQKTGFAKVRGFDLSSDAIEYAKSSAADVQLLDILKVDAVFPRNSFDIVICNDIFTVLERGKDREAIEKLVSVLKPGGVLVLNLAALSSFAGVHDIAVKMTKRYTMGCIKSLAQDLVYIKELTYWPFLLSPIIFSVRLFQRLKLLLNKRIEIKSDVRAINPSLNRLFYTITKFENKIPLPKFLGSSILAVMEKPMQKAVSPSPNAVKQKSTV